MANPRSSEMFLLVFGGAFSTMPGTGPNADTNAENVRSASYLGYEFCVWGGIGGACSPTVGDNTAPSGHCINSFVHVVLAPGSLCSLGTLEAVLLLGQIERRL